jgi:RNA polymerase sigma factor (sigma-70 family)
VTPLTAAQQELVQATLGFAESVASSTRAQLSRDEKMAAAYFALCRAVRTWPGAGTFARYAVPAIKSQIWADANLQRWGRHLHRPCQLRVEQWDDEAVDPSGDAPDPLAELVKGEESAALHAALAELTPLRQRIVALFLAGLTPKEIAHETHSTRNTINQNLLLIRSQLRGLLACSTSSPAT